jgi:nitrogen fixation NifU-like protein
MNPNEERILSHYEFPYRNFSPEPYVPRQIATGWAENDTCGDWIRYWIQVSNVESKYRIICIWWEGGGCCFSQAAASMLAERFEAVRLEDAKAFTQDDMLELFGVDVETERLECLLVSFNSFKNALEEIPHD